MKHFATQAIIFNRPVRDASFWPQDPVQKLASDQVRLGFTLRVLGTNPEALRRLLQDPDPKVRTVALGALFERDDPHDLPFIAALMDDTAATAPDLHESMSAAPGPRQLSQMEAPQTVGAIAGAMIRFYLSAAKVSRDIYNRGDEGFGAPGRPPAAAVFDAYWAERKDRARCVSWYLVKLERAAAGPMPQQSELKVDMAGVLAEIRSLPVPERDWTLLVVANDDWLPGAHSLIPDAELLRAAKEIGPDALLQFLTFKPFIADPDLRFSDNGEDPRGSLFLAISRFIMKHATELLRPQDAEAIRAHANGNLLRMSSVSLPLLWMRTADALEPVKDRARAVADLKSQMTELRRSSEAADRYRQIGVAALLWHISGAAEKGFLVQWMYGGYMNPFLYLLKEEARPDTPAMLAAIVADPRFDEASGDNVKAMLELAGGAETTPLEYSQAFTERWSNASASERKAILDPWRNALRRHYGLPEHTPPPAS